MGQATPQTVYGNNPPGGGNPFFAGLEELFSAPGSFFKDSAGVAVKGSTLGLTDAGIGGSYVGNGQPGGGSAFVAGAEELISSPPAFAHDLGDVAKDILPGSGTVTTWLIVGTVAILGLVYITHKAL